MFESFIQVFGTALSIWEHKEKNKYFEEYRELMRERQAQLDLPPDHPDRDNGVIDRAERELQLLAKRFNFAAQGSQPGN